MKDEGNSAKADLLFALYASLGAVRSLAAIQEMASAAGLPIANSTLLDYSTKYHWVERAKAFDDARGKFDKAAEVQTDVMIHLIGRSLDAR